MKQRIASLNMRNQYLLNLRRQKLANLLQFQDAQYRQQIMKKQQTSEDIRNKMQAKLNVLKAKRQQERQSQVEYINKKRFKQQADDIRLQDSKLFQQKCTFDMQNQMREKLARQKQENLQEFLYAELWKQDMEKKIERERKQAEINQKAVTQMEEIQKWQRNKKLQHQADQENMKNLEKSMLQQKWKQEEENQYLRKQQQLQHAQLKNKEIMDYNQMLIQLRNDQVQRQKDMDKVMVARILSRQRQIKQAEDNEKQKLRVQAKRILSMYDNKQELARKQEQELERLIMEQNAKKWEQDEKKWAQQAQNKRRLMIDVYNNREQAVKYHKTIREEEKLKAEEEKNALDSQIYRQNELFQAMRAQKKRNVKQHQIDILKQIGQGDRKKRDSIRAYMYEKRAMRLAELDYRQRITNEKQMARVKLESMKNNQSYMI